MDNFDRRRAGGGSGVLRSASYTAAVTGITTTITTNNNNNNNTGAVDRRRRRRRRHQHHNCHGTCGRRSGCCDSDCADDEYDAFNNNYAFAGNGAPPNTPNVSSSSVGATVTTATELVAELERLRADNFQLRLRVYNAERRVDRLQSTGSDDFGRRWLRRDSLSGDEVGSTGARAVVSMSSSAEDGDDDDDDDDAATAKTTTASDYSDDRGAQALRPIDRDAVAKARATAAAAMQTVRDLLTVNKRLLALLLAVTRRTASRSLTTQPKGTSSFGVPKGFDGHGGPSRLQVAEADALEKVAAAAVSLEDYPSDDETTAPPHHPKVVGDSYLSGSGGSRRPHGAQNYEQDKQNNSFGGNQRIDKDSAVDNGITGDEKRENLEQNTLFDIERLEDHKLFLELLKRSARRNTNKQHGYNGSQPPICVSRLEAAFRELVVGAAVKADDDGLPSAAEVVESKPWHDLLSSTEVRSRALSLPGRLTPHHPISLPLTSKPLSHEIDLPAPDPELQPLLPWDETSYLRSRCDTLERMLQQLVNTELWTQNRHICRLEQQRLLQQQNQLNQQQQNNQLKNQTQENGPLQEQRCTCCGQCPLIIQVPSLQNSVPFVTTPPAALLPDYSAVKFFHSDAAEDDYDTAAEQSPWCTGDEEEGVSASQKNDQPSITTDIGIVPSSSNAPQQLRKNHRIEYNQCTEQQQPSPEKLLQELKGKDVENKYVTMIYKNEFENESLLQNKSKDLHEKVPVVFDGSNVEVETNGCAEEFNCSASSNKSSSSYSWSSDSTCSSMVDDLPANCNKCRRTKRGSGNDLKSDKNVQKESRHRHTSGRRRQHVKIDSSTSNLQETGLSSVLTSDIRPTPSTSQRVASIMEAQTKLWEQHWEESTINDADDVTLQELMSCDREELCMILKIVLNWIKNTNLGDSENKEDYDVAVEVGGNVDGEVGGGDLPIAPFHRFDFMAEDQLLEKNRRAFLDTRQKVTSVLPQLMRPRLNHRHRAISDSMESMELSDYQSGIKEPVDNNNDISSNLSINNVENQLLKNYHPLPHNFEDFNDNSIKLEDDLKRCLIEIKNCATSRVVNEQSKHEIMRGIIREFLKKLKLEVEKGVDQLEQYDHEQDMTLYQLRQRIVVYENSETMKNNQNEQQNLQEANDCEQQRPIPASPEIDRVNEEMIMAMDREALVHIALPNVLNRIQNALAENLEEQRELIAANDDGIPINNFELENIAEALRLVRDQEEELQREKQLKQCHREQQNNERQQ